MKLHLFKTNIDVDSGRTGLAQVLTSENNILKWDLEADKDLGFNVLTVLAKDLCDKKVVELVAPLGYECEHWY